MVKKTVEKFLHCSKVKTPRSLSQGQKGLITRNIHVKYESTSTHSSNVISKVKVFKKWVKLPRSRSQGKKKMVPMESLITMNTHVKYHGSNTQSTKVISKVKVFKKWVKVTE